MKKYILSLILLLSFGITVNASKNNFEFNTKDLSFNNGKKKDVLNDINKQYNVSYKEEENDEDAEIKALTKKATYLLFGKFNGEEESSENYYKRRLDFFALRYNPTIPKDDSNIIGLDVNSKEYQDDIISGMSTGGVFAQVQEMKFIYNSYGEITISRNNDLVISQIVVPNVKYRIGSKINPYEYEYQKTDFTVTYYFKKLNDNYKIWYVWGTDARNIEEYKKSLEDAEVSNNLIAPLYSTNLEKIYSFDKLNSINESIINEIYSNNKDNVVILNSYYDGIKISNANGVFIGNGLIVTTWDFVENALIDAQYITALDSDLNNIRLNGIVTASPENNIAVLKSANKNNKVTINTDKLNIEDPVFAISSNSGLGLSIQKGIIISNNEKFKTSIPVTMEEQGRPIFNQSGDLIGLSIVKNSNEETSLQIGAKYLLEVQDQFKDISYDEIECISFKELKEKYYYVPLAHEKVINDIPKGIWKKYSKIGDVKTSIKLDLVKASYKDGLVSLRYKNNANGLINNISMTSVFRNNLKKDGYKEQKVTNSKYIYKNKEYKVVVISEFDYLIVVMQKL